MALPSTERLCIVWHCGEYSLPSGNQRHAADSLSPQNKPAVFLTVAQAWCTVHIVIVKGLDDRRRLAALHHKHLRSHQHTP